MDLVGDSWPNMIESFAADQGETSWTIMGLKSQITRAILFSTVVVPALDCLCHLMKTTMPSLKKKKGKSSLAPELEELQEKVHKPLVDLI